MYHMCLLYSFAVYWVTIYIGYHIFNCSYVGRPVAASTATGSKAQHLKELAAFLEDATRIDS